MTTPVDSTPVTPEIESDLRALTTWHGENPAIWKAALNQHAAHPQSSNRRRFMLISIALASAALVVLAVGGILNGMESGQAGRRLSVGQIAFDGPLSTPPSSPAQLRGTPETVDSPQMADAYKKADERDGRLRLGKDLGLDLAAQDSAARSVIRKSTIELAVPDTREAFAKVQHLLRNDLSEFIEASTLTGQDKEARAQLTLRVAASGARLDEVLNLLRTLGKVDSENSTGDDVTAQSVDLDARLRNERKVETELLALVESRGGKDAKLSDVLDLREKLNTVRQSIERLQAQHDSLARQVALASILVILRPDNAPKPEPQHSMFDGFTSEMSSAWTSGLTALTQTIAFLIRVLIGGLIWWLLLIAAIAIARRAIRRLIPDPARVPIAA
jgi:hypothetical protein